MRAKGVWKSHVARRGAPGDEMTRPSRFEGTIGRTMADSEAWFDDPPRTPEEWELAGRVFDDDALAEFHRWEAMFEAPTAHDALREALWPDGDAP